jgi:hypothetical protein
VPAAVQEDVLEMRRAYDYAFHADSSRPQNIGAMSQRLSSYLIDSLCVWGGEARWKATIDALAEQGWTGIMFILGQAEQVGVVQAIGERLCKLGYLSSAA